MRCVCRLQWFLSLHVCSTPAGAQDGASLQLDAVNTLLRQHNRLVLLHTTKHTNHNIR